MEASEAKIIDLVVAAAGIKPGMTVLDVGSGAGIPALRLAEIVGPEGKVVATDPSALSIEAITKHARERGLTNVEPVRASAAGLPFPAKSFDAVTCSFGVMFFTDVQAGLTRIREVLRPGARAAFVAWGSPDENELFGPFRSTTTPYLPEPPQQPGPDTPHPMRFAAPGSLSAALSAAGYRDVQVDTPLVEMVWPGPPADRDRYTSGCLPDRGGSVRLIDTTRCAPTCRTRTNSSRRRRDASPGPGRDRVRHRLTQLATQPRRAVRWRLFRATGANPGR